MAESDAVQGDLRESQAKPAPEVWPQICASEFRGREFSCRPIPAIVSLAAQAGIDESEIFAGLGYPRDHLLDVSERIDWSSARMLGKNLSRHFSDAEIVQLGASATRTRPLRFLMLIARFLFQPTEYYRFAARELSRYCTCVGAYVREVGPFEIHLHVLMEPDYPVVRELFLTLQGSLMSMAEAYGRRAAVVDLEEVPRGALFRIQLPNARGFFGFWHRLVGGGSTLRAAARDLREANELLHQRDGALLRKESQLVQAERRYRALLEGLGSPVFVIDANGRICDANQMSAAAFGLSVEALVGRSPSEWVELGSLPLRDFLGRIRSEHRAETEALARRADGSVFPVEVRCVELGEDQIQAVIVDVRERKRIEYELTRQARELDARVSARTAELERTTGELRRQQLRMAQVERIRALEHVSSKLSSALHPAVSKLIDTLQGIGAEEQLGGGGVAQSLALAHEISTVVATTLSQIGVGDGARRSRETASDLLDDAIQLLDSLAQIQQARIEVEIQEGVVPVVVDRGLFATALAAIGTNGIEAMEPGGVLQLRVSEARSGQWLHFEVSDAGRGIPIELHQRVLDPHFTTKPGRAGLGLPLALGVVQGHGGRLEILSGTEVGCTVRITLPVDFIGSRI